jgi:predicted ArsR family transcriptional regulator
MDRELEAVALLNEPARRRLYGYVTSQPEPVSRDAAAAALGISRSLAAFHLDRLAEAGLLAVEFRRLTGRTGPGAGRPSKLYGRSPIQIEVTVPPRRYRMAAGWLAEAFGRDMPAAALRDLAREHGVELGERARERAADGSRTEMLETGAAVLTEEGFAAHVDAEGQILLENCPFDAIAREHRELVCGEMNRALLEGFALGLGGESLHATLAPREGACCMVLG